MCELPESELYGKPDWCKAISVAATTYLEELDALHTKNPLIAIKLAAIGAATVSRQYRLGQDMMQRVSKWLSDDQVPIRDRIELGLLIQANWPDRYNKLDGLEEQLLDILVIESSAHPKYVHEIIEKHHEGTRAFSGDIFSSSDDPNKILLIAQNLKAFEPQFYIHALRNYLEHGRSRYGLFEAAEPQLRSIADKYFLAVQSEPGLKETEKGLHYFWLNALTYPDAKWYPIVLRRLLDAADECNNPYYAAEWNRSVALNANPQSEIFSVAIQSYTRYLQSFLTPNITDQNILRNFSRFLNESLDCALEDGASRGRNYSVPSSPKHPIVELTRQAYWDLVALATTLPTGIVLHILSRGVANDDTILATTAATKIVEVFESKAKQNLNEAAEVVGFFDCYHWSSGVNDVKRARCLDVWRQLSTILTEVSPEAAKKAETFGRNPMWDR
ncbi:hypothetical protein H8K35_02890 [Undibacterium sp. LX40W]|nr:hypothetical protein [Undibacterium sp. LX40W]